MAEFYEFVTPPVDIFEEGAELVIVIDLPGFQKKDIQLSISKDILTIRAKRTLDVDAVTVHYRQRPSKIEKGYLCLYRMLIRRMSIARLAT